jgi:small subunit ribosomal protein S4
MARYTGPVCKICRREGLKLFLKGIRCNTDKCAFDRRPYASGMQSSRRRKQSGYGIQLREKQKVRKTYGLLEKQFRLYFYKAERMKGATGENLLQLLERRLDNVIYRCSFSMSRQQARQLLLHGHFLVNGKKVNIPSFLVSEGDIIEIKESSRKIRAIEESLAAVEHKQIPDWIEADTKNFTIKMLHLPTREDIPLPVEEQLIVELYSK